MGNVTTNNSYQGTQNNQRNQTMRSDTDTTSNTYGNNNNTMGNDTTNNSYQGNQGMNNDTSKTYNNSYQSGQSNNNMAANTGQNGTFKINNIPAGTYTLKVTSNNYKTWKQQVNIKKNGYRTIHLKKGQ